ncbi:hypothetical protein MATL_G00143280 [Megalops atlanticus]|uniref:Olfactomedin-like domain-containing protein n=1 Tax=Megalops atlanticus TaxID=7932 RepID=A0A9D3T675_MEGAT|nr:hypothetical protein MATL_G00143280 [Megalops atlanticus]
MSLTPLLWSLLPLLCLFTECEGTQRVEGQQLVDSCLCEVDTTLWDFPAQMFENVSDTVQTCRDSLEKLQAQVLLTDRKMPKITATVQNITDRLRAFQYLNSNSLYHALHLRQLNKELEELEKDIKTTHHSGPNAQTKGLTQEVGKVREEVKDMQKKNVFNLETVRENLRSMRNRLESCRTIHSQFRSNCSQRLMTNISSPVVTKLNPYGKSYPSGSWGRETKPDSPESYWVQPLVSSSKHGNVVRHYHSFEDFMASRNAQDVPVASSYSHSNAIQGPGSLLYGEAMYYQCYNTGELCRYDMRTHAVTRKLLPNAGFSNQFPYCYYSCRDWTDIDLSADEMGLWVLYATERSHGNLVVSRLEAESLNVTNTWTTRLFKKAATNAFMVCGVLYATRYDSRYREEVFYAFDTLTGKEDNTLSIPLEKVGDGVANLHYNPVDRMLYMYNDYYLMSYRPYF